MSTLPTRPKIPDPVPLAKVDAERQKIYGGLKPVDAIPPQLIPVKPIQEATSEHVEDKKEFVRSILGRTSFTKKYTLFGRVNVKMATRTVLQTEKLYELTAHVPEAERDSWFNRFSLLSTLKSVIDSTHGNYFDVPENLLEGNWQELVDKFLLTMPLPMYSALIDVSASFEKLVEDLTEKAAEPGFWPTVGPS